MQCKQAYPLLSRARQHASSTQTHTQSVAGVLRKACIHMAACKAAQEPATSAPVADKQILAQQGHCHCWYTSNTHIDTHTYPGSVVCCLLGEKQAQIEGRPRPVSSAWLHMCMWRRHSSMPAQLAAARHTAARERHLPGTRSVRSSAASRICTEACTPTVQSHLPRKSTCLPARPAAAHHAHTAQYGAGWGGRPLPTPNHLQHSQLGSCHRPQPISQANNSNNSSTATTAAQSPANSPLSVPLPSLPTQCCRSAHLHTLE